MTDHDPLLAVRRGEDLRVLGRFTDAERVLHTALAEHPGHAELLCVLAAVLRQDGRPAEALRAADAAVGADPSAGHAHRQRALALSATGSHRAAAEAGATAVRLDPHDAVALIVHAAVLREGGALPAASAAARRAVQLAPEEPTAHIVVAHIHSTLGDTATARKAYRETLRLDPENAAARHDLAVLDLRRGRTRLALDGLLAAGTMGPADGMALVLYNVAAVLWRLAWYLRIVLLVGCIAVGGVSGPAPGIASRVAAAGTLAAAGLLAWRFTRRLPVQARSVLPAALRGDGLLAVTYALSAVAVALLLVVIVTGYGRLGIVVWLVILVQFLLALVSGIRSRRRQRA